MLITCGSFSINRVSIYEGTIGAVEHADTSPELTNQLLSFCPRYWNLLPGVGSSRNMDACVMLVDITGFTKLSSKLCAEGSKGIDKLRLVTNSTLAHFINTIYSFDGDGICPPLDILILITVLSQWWNLLVMRLYASFWIERLIAGECK